MPTLAHVDATHCTLSTLTIRLLYVKYVLVRSPPIENVHTQIYQLCSEKTDDSVAMYLSITR